MLRERTNKDIWSYSFGVGFAEFATALFAALLNYYYVRTMGLSNGWFLVAQTIYAIYNAINDPLVGFVTGRPYGFSRRLGRHYPWIMIGGLGTLLFVILVYAAPFRSQVGLFAWMLVTLCITDTFFSMFSVNHQSLSPNLFRSAEQRRRLGAISTVVSTASMLAGFIVPEFGDISSPTGYLKPMLIGAGIGIVMLLILRPSVREEPELTERLFEGTEGGSPKGFFRLLWESFRHKNFLLFIVLFLCFNTLSMTAISSLPYFLEFVLEVPIEKANSTKTMLIMVEFVGVFASIPVWSMIARKSNMKTTAVASNLVIVLCLVPFFFVDSVGASFAVFFALGLGVGGFWVAILPLLSDTIDEITASLGTHEEGVYFGVKTFFMRLSLILQALIYWAVRGITGFTPQTMRGERVTEAMRFGIRFEFGGVTALLLLAATLLFLAKYDLTPERIAAIRLEIEAREKAGTTEGRP